MDYSVYLWLSLYIRGIFLEPSLVDTVYPIAQLREVSFFFFLIENVWQRLSTGEWSGMVCCTCPVPDDDLGEIHLHVQWQGCVKVLGISSFYNWEPVPVDQYRFTWSRNCLSGCLSKGVKWDVLGEMYVSYVDYSCVHHSLKYENNLGVYGWIDKENSFHSVLHYTFTQVNYTYMFTYTYMHTSGICTQPKYVSHIPWVHMYTHTCVYNGILFICKNHLAIWDSTDESGVYYVKLNKPSPEEEYRVLSFVCANWKGQIRGNFWFFAFQERLYI